MGKKNKVNSAFELLDKHQRLTVLRNTMTVECDPLSGYAIRFGSIEALVGKGEPAECAKKLAEGASMSIGMWVASLASKAVREALNPAHALGLKNKTNDDMPRSKFAARKVSAFGGSPGRLSVLHSSDSEMLGASSDHGKFAGAMFGSESIAGRVPGAATILKDLDLCEPMRSLPILHESLSAVLSSRKGEDYRKLCDVLFSRFGADRGDELSCLERLVFRHDQFHERSKLLAGINSLMGYDTSYLMLNDKGEHIQNYRGYVFGDGDAAKFGFDGDGDLDSFAEIVKSYIQACRESGFDDPAVKLVAEQMLTNPWKIYRDAKIVLWRNGVSVSDDEFDDEFDDDAICAYMDPKDDLVAVSAAISEALAELIGANYPIELPRECSDFARLLGISRKPYAEDVDASALGEPLRASRSASLGEFDGVGDVSEGNPEES